jgi:hypothetical protein
MDSIELQIFNINKKYLYSFTKMFNPDVIYPYLLRHNYSVGYLFTNKLLDKILSYVKFTDDNKNKHLDFLCMFIRYKRFYILKGYEKYQINRDEKNRMMVDVMYYMKKNDMDNDDIVMVCKMIQ